MFQNSLATASGSTSSFHTIFRNALNRYRKNTKEDLFLHPLTADIQNCKLPSDILAVLDKKYNVQEFIQAQSDDETSQQWLSATFTVLASFSATLAEDVGPVLSPAKVIFAGVGILLIAAKDVGVDKDTLVHIFGRIEFFFKRLETFVELSPTDAMKELVIRIIVEVLELLAVMTKEIKQRFAKKYLKKLAGRTDIEDALKRLDKLTHEGVVMANVQIWEPLEGTENKINKVIDGKNKARGVMRKNLREWLSPPDHSINYRTARNIYHVGTARWFTQGETFERWKASGSESLLWIHGKPGSGKSVLSSAIIHDTMHDSNTETPCVIYFFFDFKDEAKQDTSAFFSSLLVQLCRRSDSCFKALLDMYSTHSNGTRQPSESALSQCLKDMLIVLGRVPIYLIVDALDESPNTAKVLGEPPPRQQVLEVVKELVELRLSNLHICVTSRPEVDIRSALELLACFKVSIHDQSGQKEDIDNFLRSVVYSDNRLTNWSQEDKDLVIKTLSEKANGTFRWVVCKLDALRPLYDYQIRVMLSEFPASLGEIYQHVLRRIDKGSRKYVYRLLQCLMVSTRPLRVEELVEVLVADIDGADGIPKLNPDRPWVDPEDALAACSSFITIIDTGDARVVEFSHFSVRQFLTSVHLARSRGGVSRYHISLEPAHTTLAQACICVLLRLDDRVQVSEDSTRKSFPLAQYAARHWVKHAQFGNVSSSIRKEMKELFDPDRPHFSAWLRLYDLDTPPDTRSAFFQFADPSILLSTPLYYAALCGFHDLAEYLLVKHPQLVNAIGGYYVTPLVAALAGNHFQVAQLLYQRGADVNVRGHNKQTPLFSASRMGYPKTVQWLLGHGADVNVQVALSSSTPLLATAREGYPQVARILLDHNADIKARDNNAGLHYTLHRDLVAPLSLDYCLATMQT